MILQNKLLALLNEVLGQNAKVRKGGNEASYFCCFCNHYKRKLEFNLETGQWSCWVCNARGSYIGSFLTRIKAPRKYRDKAFELTKDVRLQRRTKTKTVENELNLPVEFISMLVPPPENTDQNRTLTYKHAWAYLKQRGIGLEEICRYNIGYCIEGRYENCVVVPSYDEEGKLNYFSSRYIYPHTWFKYKNAPFSKNIVGFECFVNYDEPITLVEGVFDAIAVRNNAVPLFGTILSKHLKEQLVLHRTKRVNVILDNDAMQQALHMVEELWKWGIIVHLIKLDEKDPSEMGFNRIHELIENSKPVEFKELIFQKLLL